MWNRPKRERERKKKKKKKKRTAGIEPATLSLGS
jgi:hypothetical protein